MKRQFILAFIISFFTIFFVNISNVSAIDIDSKILDILQEKEKEIIESEKKIYIQNTNYKKLNIILENNVKEILKVEEERRKEEEWNRQLSFKEQIVYFASQFVGNPYVMGGNSLVYGTDCSGFVQLVYANFGIYLPRTTYEQSISGYGVGIDEIMPGDIISYGYGSVSHSALYVGNGMIIHASTPELGIRYDSMYIMPILAIRRI